MELSVKTIINEVYSGDESQGISTRLNILYGVLFDILKQEDKQQVYSEIIAYEKTVSEDLYMYVSEYESLTPDLILSTFSALSFECARMRLNGEKSVKLAEYEQMIYSQLLGVASVISEDTRKRKASLISETLMDFAYASGKTDNMSLRLHNII